MLRKLKTFRELILPLNFPSLSRSIMIAIGCAEEQGRYLTVKEVGLLGLGPLGSVRRHLDRLVVTGWVEKRRVESDGRAIQLVTTGKFRHRRDQVGVAIRMAAYEIVSAESGVARTMKTDVIVEAKTWDEIATVLKEKLQRIVAVRSLRVSCRKNATNCEFFALIDVDAAAAPACAARIGGSVFGLTTVCAFFPRPVNFQCPNASAGEACDGVSL